MEPADINLPDCNVCGANKWYLDAGLYFCRRCNTQSQFGVQTVVGAEFEENFVTTREIRIRKEKKKKQADTGRRWSTFEAFNHILAAQTRVLTEKLNLGPEFKDTVLGVWLLYLERCQIAFIDYDFSKPKLHFRAHHRDRQVFIYDQEQVPLYKRNINPHDGRYTNNARDPKLAPKKRGQRGLVQTTRLGACVFKEIRIREEASAAPVAIGGDLNDEEPTVDLDLEGSDEEENEDPEERDSFRSKINAILDSMPLTSASHCRQLDAIVEQHCKKLDRILMKELQNLSPADLDEEDSSSTKSTLSGIDLISSYSFVELRKHFYWQSYEPINENDPFVQYANQYMEQDESILSIKHEPRDEDEDQDSNSPKRRRIDEEDQEENIEVKTEPDVKREIDEKKFLNRRVRNLSRLYDIKKIQHISGASLNQVDSMSMSKTLAILYIVFRVLNLDVYISDLVRWVAQGHLPYYDSCRHMPADWLFTHNDQNLFVPVQFPQYKTMQKFTGHILRFMSSDFNKTLPQADLYKLIERYLRDLNLPLIILNYIRNNEKCRKCISDYMKPDDKVNGQIRYYERFCLSFILVVLRMLFRLDNESDQMLGHDYRDRLPPGPERDQTFIWSEWISYFQVRAGLLRQTFTPLFDTDCDEMATVEPYHSYRRDVCSHWKINNLVLSQKPAAYMDPQTFEQVHESYQELQADESTISGQKGQYDIKFSTLFLTEATESSIRTLNDNDPRISILRKDFTKMKFPYLDTANQWPNDPNTPQLLQHYKGLNLNSQSMNNRSPMSPAIELLLTVMSWMAQTYPEMLCMNLYSIEKALFLNHQREAMLELKLTKTSNLIEQHERETEELEDLNEMQT